MIRSLIALIVAVLIATGAFVGTAASRTVHPPPPTYDWSGWYAGVSGGYGWGSSSQTDSGIPCSFFATCEGELFDGSYSPKGGILGGTFGYSWQRGAVRHGLEAR